MNVTTIYIVEGSSGEYSDREDWIVAAYTEEAEARKHAEAAGAYSRETRQRYENAGDDWERQDKVLRSRGRGNPHDHLFADNVFLMQIYARYTVHAVPVRERAPTASDPMPGEAPKR